MEQKTKKISVLIPCYNEELNVEPISQAAVSYTHLDVYKRQIRRNAGTLDG